MPNMKLLKATLGLEGAAPEPASPCLCFVKVVADWLAPNDKTATFVKILHQ